MPEAKRSSKREEMRAMHRRRQRNVRLAVIAVIGGIVLLFLAIVIIPSLLNSPADIEIVDITPIARSNPDGTSAGDPNAPVRIDVYEDFQCPACVRYTEEVESQIMSELVASGQVYYTFHHFPFLDDGSFVKESDQAANASMCANEQDRFWDYHDILFANWSGENQGAFSDRRLLAMAERLGLDMDAFESCFQANRYQAEINADLESGRSLGITGTPAVLVNGQEVSPGLVPTYNDIAAAVAEAAGQ
jgi:protein-disulfide isomerase